MKKLRIALHALLIACILLFGTWTPACAAPGHHAKDSLSQDEKITVKLDHTSLLASIKMVESQVKLNFIYDNQLLGSFHQEITHRFDDATLHEVLSFLLKNTRLEYLQEGKNIILRPKPAQARPGSIRGRVVDFENGNPLAGATVSISGNPGGMVTNEQGYFEIKNIQPGTYILIFSYVGYQTSRLANVKVTEDKTTVADFKLQASSKLDEVVIRSGPRRRAVVNTTDEQLVHELYTARTVVSGISNEQIVRSTDVDAAEVVKRISGVNVTDDRFIVVRGMNKRYNVTFLNNNIAPSTEPDSKAFSYDQIPSNAIDHMLVYKSPSPDLPGEFAGGVVKIYTKKSMFTRQLDIQISAQYRPGSNFTDVLSYPGSKTDWLGFDDGTRKLPAGLPSTLGFNYLSTPDNARLSAAFKDNYQATHYHSDLDKRIVLNYYDAWRLGSRHLNNLTSVSFTNTTTNYLISTQRNAGLSKGFIEQGSFNGRIGLIQTNNINLNKNLTLELKNFINQQGTKALSRINMLRDADYSQYQRNTNLGFQTKFVYSGQLSSYLNWGKLHRNDLFINLGYTRASYSDPDLRQIPYSKIVNDSVAPVSLQQNMLDDRILGPWRLGNSSDPGMRRLFTTVKERSYQANTDFEHAFSNEFHIKAGTYWEFRTRDVSLRSFDLANNIYDPNITTYGYTKPGEDGMAVTEERINYVLRPEMFRADGSGFHYVDRSEPGDNYLAENRNISGYLSMDLHSHDKKWEAFGGLRVEDNQLRILGAQQTGLALYPIDIKHPLTSWLPSVNISWRPDSALILRAGYGRTVNRPEFREVAPFSYKDFLNLYNYTGNPELTTVNIHNADLRLEWYPRSMLRNEMFSVGLFYKHLDHPIEQILSRYIEDEALYWNIIFTNSGPANVYGAEAEIRKSLSFVSGRIFKNLSVVMNSTLIYSRVNSPGMNLTGNRTGRKRPLQGQPPYIVNMGLHYEDPAKGRKLALIYNRSGDMLTLLGNNDGDLYDVMQRGRDQLDATFTQRINKFLHIKAGVQNLLNAPLHQYEDRKRNYKYDGAADAEYRNYKTGAYYSLALNFIF